MSFSCWAISAGAGLGAERCWGCLRARYTYLAATAVLALWSAYVRCDISQFLALLSLQLSVGPSLQATGDELVVNTYKRLSPLRVLPQPIPHLGDLQKGDCVVAFSRREIYRLKAEIEETTKLRCSVV